ncbi:HAD-IA family hydrolase [Rubrobacter aplysinae]|uniref:HAD-IA family hydrolase n=1 Tax=Rubrobacter aplysinae TaxID=909625 RepID=UPI00064BA974|nr:HAD-IA family hydrolase [Rubrobacter aplysinae]
MGQKRETPLSAVLFDFDGTLVDTTELIHQSMRHATSAVLGRDYPRERLLNGVGTPLPEQMKAFDPERVDELLESYRSHQEAHHDELIKEFPGVEKALSRLQEAGLDLGVVTSKRRASVDQALETFPGLGRVVDRFVTMEDTTEHKPRPEPLLRGLQMLGATREEAVYVGDAPYDVAAAKAAGLVSVAVSWGAFPHESLREAGPDHLSEDIGGVVDTLLRLAGQSQTT